jgi:nucleoside-diphosphate-sugar epimerase
LPHLGSLRGNRYVVFGDGSVPLQLTYVENTVEALWLCAVVPQAAGETFTIIDDNLPTQREFVALLGELTGRPLRVTAIPRPAAYLIGFGVEALAGALKKRPPTTRRLLIGKTAKLSFDTTRAKRILGWQPAVSWQEGLRRGVLFVSANAPLG